jgi:hypothetical protein
MNSIKIKNNMLLFACLCLFISILPLHKVSSEVVYQCTRYTTDHDWWNPLDWFVGYADVSRLTEIGYVGSTLVIQETILCTGQDDLSCPSCGSSLSVHPSDYILDQDFIDESTLMLESHVISSISDSIYSGYQSFNTTYNNTTILRNVSWVGDTTSTEVNLIMNIVPVPNP